jgi:hypothetical protein
MPPLLPAFHAELGEDLGDVVAGARQADAQTVCDQLVRQPTAQEVEHILLAGVSKSG